LPRSAGRRPALSLRRYRFDAAAAIPSPADLSRAGSGRSRTLTIGLHNQALGGSMPAAFPVTEHVAKSARHTTFYLACGAEDAPAIIFTHGWPELSISWRHQLPVFAALGFRAIAPDMRGYGRSSVYPRHEDYALEQTVQDMIELIDSLGRERAVWVGHDWGSPVVWSMASHHPERCFAVANLCVPYISRGFAPANFIPLVDRTVYPEAEFPGGQWEYMFFYEENFAAACAGFDANVLNSVKAIFRADRRPAGASPRGPPMSVGMVAGSAPRGRRPTCRWTRWC
jgi:pimeloyl-ACP methyl ester carboxylesterase